MQTDHVFPWFLGEKRCLGAFTTDDRSDVLGHLEELGWHAWLKSWLCLKMLKIPHEALLDFSDLGPAFSLSLSFSPPPPVTWATVILRVTDSMVVLPTGDPPRISQLSPKAPIIPPSTHPIFSKHPLNTRCFRNWWGYSDDSHGDNIRSTM